MSNNFNYSAVRTTSKIDGTTAQEICAMYDAKNPDKTKLIGHLSKASKNDLYVFICCQCPMTLVEIAVIEPRLLELQIDDWDRPSELPKDDYTQDETKAIVHTEYWSEVIE